VEVTSAHGRTSRKLDAPWLKQGPLARLLAVLSVNGDEARVVGGAVRNALLGEPIHEIDIATTAVPDEVVRRVTAAGFKAVPTGIEHGTVTVVANGQAYEVTTLRQDVETFGRHATVAFGRDWRADAERRDFTINAFSVAPDGTLYDYVGGLADLGQRRIRFIGSHSALLSLSRSVRAWRSRRGWAACVHRRPRRPRQTFARTRAHGNNEASDRRACDADSRRDERDRVAAAGAGRRALSGWI
jgi:hypothetical protein